MSKQLPVLNIEGRITTPSLESKYEAASPSQGWHLIKVGGILHPKSCIDLIKYARTGSSKLDGTEEKHGKNHISK